MDRKPLFITTFREWDFHDIRTGQTVMVPAGRYQVARIDCPRFHCDKLVLMNYSPDACIGMAEGAVRQWHDGQISPKTLVPISWGDFQIRFENDDAPERNIGYDEINPRADFGFGHDGNMIIHEIFVATHNSQHIDRSINAVNFELAAVLVAYFRGFGFVVDCDQQLETIRVRHPQLV
ncbi:TPA: hypothetical protein DF272_03710 [Candidatus Falkowbacteria bacterium]|nr:hypothetical protein [Candidatus Falkowbacteria bacterium]